MSIAHSQQLQQLLKTPIGPFRALWTEEGLFAFEFFRSTTRPLWSREKDLPAQADQLVEAVSQYFETGIFQWNLRHLDWQGMSKFHRKVLESCYKIASASTLTYGELATKVGSPGAARAVGGVMARNRWPLLIPCHRVVGSGGKLTGYSGSGGLATKRKLLELEAEIACGVIANG